MTRRHTRFKYVHINVIFSCCDRSPVLSVRRIFVVVLRVAFPPLLAHSVILFIILPVDFFCSTRWPSSPVLLCHESMRLQKRRLPSESRTPPPVPAVAASVNRFFPVHPATVFTLLLIPRRVSRNSPQTVPCCVRASSGQTNSFVRSLCLPSACPPVCLSDYLLSVSDGSQSLPCPTWPGSYELCPVEWQTLICSGFRGSLLMLLMVDTSGAGILSLIAARVMFTAGVHLLIPS